MARTVCPKCGFSNKGKVNICSSCGYYMLPDQIVTTSAATYRPAAAQRPEPEAATSDLEAGTTVAVKDIGGNTGRIIYAASYILLIALLALVYSYDLNVFYILPFLVAVFAISPLIRRFFSGVKYTQTGFTVLGQGDGMHFSYDVIDAGQTWRGLRGHQFLRLKMKDQPQPITMEFFSLTTFRTMFINMRRKGINITIAEMGPGNRPSRMM